MSLPLLTESQNALLKIDAGGRVFLEGPAGCGKTTAGAARLAALLEGGVPGGEVLVLLPQRTLAVPYQDVLQNCRSLKGSLPSIITLSGLARRMVDLYWPLVAGEAGFTDPTRPPIFLTLETAQYFMARTAAPLLEQGYFESLAIDRNRLYSQILDNLNKAALVGFPYDSYADRLKAAWIGLESQSTLYDHAQETAISFRRYCLAHNLLDFSLQLEVFINSIYILPEARDLLHQTYRHLIYDNIEEDTPVAHDLTAEWLPDFDSVLLVYDRDGGFRYFLGADPVSALRLKALCNKQIEFTTSFTTPPDLAAWAEGVSAGLTENTPAAAAPPSVSAVSHRYQPEMVCWTADEIERLVREEKQDPGEIAILAPILGGTLRFLLVEELSRRGIAAQSHRPSRSLREQPAAECLLTLAALAHPDWDITPTSFELQQCLTQAVEGLDPVRAHLLVKVVYRQTKEITSLVDFAGVTVPELRDRISYTAGNRYDQLKAWLDAYQAGPPVPLDHFISRLFGEVLSQPGFGFHRDPAGGATAASLVESIRKFRVVLSETGEDQPNLGVEYFAMLKQGVLAALYLGDWNERRPDAIWISPATTFLMRNQPVDIQFWLDIGNQAWWERLYQPLTHPYVLNRNWTSGARWSEQDELDSNRMVLARLVKGLTRRCRKKVYINYSELSSQGYDQRSPFLHAIQRSLQVQEAG